MEASSQKLAKKVAVVLPPTNQNYRIMRKFYLKSVASGQPIGEISCVEGFKSAEKKANEMLQSLINDGYIGSDTYVALSVDERDVKYLDTDVYILQTDYFGDISWFRLIYGTYCYLCDRLINEEEKSEMDEWREEKDLHVLDLGEDGLKKLRGEITIGSCYLSDYENSFYIDTNEVSSYAERYEMYLEEENLQDTPKNFADYIIGNA